MAWLRDIFMSSSSSSTWTPYGQGEYHHHCPGVPEDESPSIEICGTDKGVVVGDYGEWQYFEDQGQSEHDDEGDGDATMAGLYRVIIGEEELALGLQQSLKLQNYPEYYDTFGNYIFQPSASSPSSYRKWDKYGQSTEISDTRILGWNDTVWFPNPHGYLEGSSCGSPPAGYEFVEADNYPYYERSYSSIICDVCKEPVPVDSHSNPQYREVPVFHQKTCSKHCRDGTPRCFSCERLQPRGTRYTSYDDGRMICGDCKKSAIMNERDCRPLVDEILKFYDDLDMKVRQDNIPIYMLDKNEMNKGLDAGKLTRGATESNEYSLLTMIQTPRFGKDNKIIGTKKEQFKLAGYKYVERIELLNGCPKLYIGRTLAHEMMHAWVRLEDYRESRKHVKGFSGTIPSNLEEGMCQVMAHIWIESKIRELSRNKLTSASSELQFERKLAEHIKHVIETNPDPEYGGGFRKALGVVNKYGLKGTLSYIRMTGSFPE